MLRQIKISLFVGQRREVNIPGKVSADKTRRCVIITAEVCVWVSSIQQTTPSVFRSPNAINWYLWLMAQHTALSTSGTKCIRGWNCGPLVEASGVDGCGEWRGMKAERPQLNTRPKPPIIEEYFMSTTLMLSVAENVFEVNFHMKVSSILPSQLIPQISSEIKKIT